MALLSCSFRPSPGGEGWEGGRSCPLHLCPPPQGRGREGPISFYFLVRRRELGVDAALPLVELALHRCGSVGFALGNIVLLGKVARQIVQFRAAVLKEFDEFPIAVADGGGGAPALVAVVGVVPVDGAAGEVGGFFLQ